MKEKEAVFNLGSRSSEARDLLQPSSLKKATRKLDGFRRVFAAAVGMATIVGVYSPTTCLGASAPNSR